jgi:hypothetical protein
MESNTVQKLGSGLQRIINLKKCDKTETEGFKFWKNLAQTETITLKF